MSIAKGLLVTSVSLCVLFSVPVPPSRVRDDLRECFVWSAENRDRIAKLADASIVAAHKHHIDSNLLLAVLVTEAYKRRPLAHFLEDCMVQFGVYSRRLGLPFMCDVSLGVAQMKLSTAMWIESGFLNATPLSHCKYEELARIRTKLLDPVSSVHLAAQYLSYLAQIELSWSDDCPSKITRTSIASGSTLSLNARIASRYRGGIPHSASCITDYGRFVAVLSDKDWLHAVLATSEGKMLRWH